MTTDPAPRTAGQTVSGLPDASAILELARLPIAFTAGPGHIVQYVNSALCSMLGKTREELIGGSCGDVLPDGLASRGPTCRELLDRVYRTGRPESHAEQQQGDYHPGHWSVEVWPISAGGDGASGLMIAITETTLFQQQATAMNEALLLSSIRQHELTDAAESLSASLHLEMNERQLADAALRESEERYRVLFAAAPMALFVCDRNAVIQYYNARAVELWGREPACGIERHCGSMKLWLPNGTLLPHSESPMVEVLRTGISALNIEVFIERPDGSRLPVLVNFGALKNAQGEITGAITSFVDLSQRKAAEAALLKSEKLASVGRMAASVSHEINNPLEAVVNTLFLALTTPGLPAAARDYLEIADGEIKRIAHITRQTLGFYREPSAATSNSAAGLLDSVVDLLQAKIRAKWATVQTQCRGDLEVRGVSGELRQVLANLLINSLDAIDDAGTVKLRASVSSSHDGERCIRITVADNGCGIDTTAMKQLFEPFFTTKGSVGTGLGLWVSKQLIRKQGGSIRVRSNTAGARRGTTFSLLLPGGTGGEKAPKEEDELSS